jgi:hypothetical protein
MILLLKNLKIFKALPRLIIFSPSVSNKIPQLEAVSLISLDAKSEKVALTPFVFSSNTFILSAKDKVFKSNIPYFCSSMSTI